MTPCVLLSFPLFLLHFPLVSLQHPCSLLASATFAAHLCWLVSIPGLSSLYLCEPHPAFCSMIVHTMKTLHMDLINSFLRTRTLVTCLGPDTAHIWGFTDLWSSLRPSLHEATSVEQMCVYDSCRLFEGPQGDWRVGWYLLFSPSASWAAQVEKV